LWWGMRVLFVFIVLAISLSLSGCSRPHQAAYAKPLPSSWENPQARPSPQKRTKARSAKPPQPVGQRPKRTRPSSAKPTQAVRLPESTQARSVPPLPPRKPEQDHSPTSGEGSGDVEQETEAKFKAAEAKAKREGVHSLTSEDIQGLSPEQIKELRGY
jgi:hypothetical protein